MRVDVRKILFIGAEKVKEHFFKMAQELGVVHFINPTGANAKEIPEDVLEALKAIKVLRGQPVCPQEEDYPLTKANSVVDEVLSTYDKLRAHQEDERVLTLEIERVRPFGDFSFDDISYIENAGNKKVQFFCTSPSTRASSLLPEGLIYISSANNLEYFIAINDEDKQYDRMVEMKIDKPVKSLRQELAATQKKIHEEEHQLQKLARFSDFLHHAVIDKYNSDSLNFTQNYTRAEADGAIFFVEGWVPESKLIEVKKLADSSSVFAEEVARKDSDVVPTRLENEGVARIGEDLVHIYDTPSPTDKDPSLWVLCFFSLFFAMIIGDAGYGLVFLAITLYIKYSAEKKTELGSRVLNLSLILCVSIIAWGLLTTSFFGISFGMDNPLRKYSLMTWLVEKKADYHMAKKDEVYNEWTKKYPEAASAKDGAEFVRKAVDSKEGKKIYPVVDKFTDNIMMELALFIGAVHVIISLFRYSYRNWPAIGWILFIVGAYLYTPHFLKASSLTFFAFGINPDVAAQGGYYLMIGGVILAVVLSLIQNRLLGLLEASNVIQIFGDILSYLRIYALGLSGAMLTATINEMAGGLNFVFAAVIIVLGHVTNMILGVMGGVIHGLRLNFLEWYHYSFEGGGKLFKPLQKKKIE